MEARPRRLRCTFVLAIWAALCLVGAAALETEQLGLDRRRPGSRVLSEGGPQQAALVPDQVRHAGDARGQGSAGGHARPALRASPRWDAERGPAAAGCRRPRAAGGGPRTALERHRGRAGARLGAQGGRAGPAPLCQVFAQGARRAVQQARAGWAAWAPHVRPGLWWPCSCGAAKAEAAGVLLSGGLVRHLGLARWPPPASPATARSQSRELHSCRAPCRWLKASRYSHEAVRARRLVQAKTGFLPLPDPPPAVYPGCHVFVVSRPRLPCSAAASPCRHARLA